MEKVLQEFRIIETDDGFRIEIKGDKDQLRDWVMHLNPQHWIDRDPDHGHGHGHGPRFGPPWMRHAGSRFWMRFAPPGWGPAWDEEDDIDDEEWAKRKRGRGRGYGHGRAYGQGHGEHAHDAADDVDTAQA